MKQNPFSRMWDRLSLRTKGLVMVATPLAVLVVPMALLFVNLQQRNQAQEWVSETMQVRAQIQEIATNLSRAESEIRGYRLTGEKRFLMEFGKSGSKLRDDVEQLAGLVLDNPEQRERVSRLEPLVAMRLKVLEATGARPLEQGSAPPDVQVLMQEGARLTATIRNGLAAMQREEDRQFQQRSALLARARHQTQLLLLVVVVFGVGSTLLAVSGFTTDILNRVRTIERNARLLADGWQLEPQSLGSDELGRLQSAIESTSQLLTSNIRELQVSRRRLQSLFDTTPDMLLFADDEGRYVEVNPAARALVGFDPEELVGQSAEILTSPEHRGRWRAMWTEFLEAGEQKGEFRLVHKSGETVDVEYYAIANIEPGLHLGVLRDISSRKQAEAALRLGEERYRSLVEATSAIVWDTPASGEFQNLQRGWSAFTGQSWEELRRWGWLQAVHPDDREQTAQAWSAAVQSRTLHETEHRLRRHDSEYRHMMVRAVPILDGEGAVREWIGVHTDVTQRKEIEVALRQSTLEADKARRDAEQANLAKSDFLSRMSHELRTPLNAILGFGQLLEFEPLNPDQKDSVEQILRAGRHLLELINEVLDVARIEAGRMTLSPEPVLVQQVVSEVHALIQPLAAEVAVTIHDELDRECAHFVQADRQRLKQVLLNLLANAVKYNVRGGEIFLSCSRHTRPTVDTLAGEPCEFLKISVRDTGLGMGKESLEKLFSPFERLNEDNPQIEGSGLGLVLSKQLTELMNGTISVESGAGEGSTFSVEFPIVQGWEEDAKAMEAVAEGFVSTAGLDRDQSILYIEDNFSNLKLIERILQQDQRAALLTAMQGRIGLELARQHQPDLILLDLHLPDIDGVEVLRQLRQDALTQAIPVIMISADATERQIQRLLELGATDYLTKPLDVGRFLQVLEDVFGQTQQTQV